MDYLLSDSLLPSTTDTTDTCWNKVHFISLQVTGKKPNRSANATFNVETPFLNLSLFIENIFS